MQLACKIVHLFLPEGELNNILVYLELIFLLFPIESIHLEWIIEDFQLVDEVFPLWSDLDKIFQRELNIHQFIPFLDVIE